MCLLQRLLFLVVVTKKQNRGERSEPPVRENSLTIYQSTLISGTKLFQSANFISEVYRPLNLYKALGILRSLHHTGMINPR